MGLPTGTISLSQVNTELGKGSTSTISLNDSDVRTLGGKASGTISMSDLRGKSSESWRYTGRRIALPYKVGSGVTTQGVAYSRTSGKIYVASIKQTWSKARLYELKESTGELLRYTEFPNQNVTGIEIGNGLIYFTEDSYGYILKTIVPGDPNSVKNIFALSTKDPFDVAIDASGWFYIVDRRDNLVYQHTPTGVLASTWEPSDVLYPLACCYGGAGVGIWIGDGQQGRSSISAYGGSGNQTVDKIHTNDVVSQVSGITWDSKNHCIWIVGVDEGYIYQYKEV